MSSPWEKHLKPGETILWEGNSRAQVDRRMLMRPENLFFGLFALVGLLSFPLSLVVETTRAGVSAEAPLLQSLLIALVFCVPLVFSLFMSVWERKRTRYLLTDMRALVLNRARFWPLRLRGFPWSKCKDVQARSRGAVRFRTVCLSRFLPPDFIPSPFIWDLAFADVDTVVSIARAQMRGGA